MAFHERLRQARERAEMTQAQISSLIGVAKSTYSGYETGKSEPSMQIISCLMRILNVKPEFLWQDEVETDFRNNYPEQYFNRPDMAVQTNDEEELLSKYRLLTPSAKETVLTTIRAFAANPDMVKETPNKSVI
ncbi:MAG: helix-turn-helix domain-containing protein [Clostridia bacterium]|nr:helix-turn-helix domain-containing protein [Clostridia bacterium]